VSIGARRYRCPSIWEKGCGKVAQATSIAATADVQASLIEGERFEDAKYISTS
jgi:hypothetical protein